MGLEDKFFPEDGSLITNFDNFMIKQAGKIGTVYQNWTGKSYQELTKNVHSLADKGYKLSLPFLGVYGIIKIMEKKLGNNLEPTFVTPLEEENAYEYSGINKKYGKYYRTTGMVVLPLVVGIGFNITEPFDLNSFKDYFMLWKGSGLIVEGVAGSLDLFSEYLSRSNLPKPPKETIPQKIKDKLVSLSSPALPQPTAN